MTETEATELGAFRFAIFVDKQKSCYGCAL